MQTIKQVRICLSDRESTKVSTETPGGAAGTVEKTEAKFFMQSQGENHCTKNELNLLSKNSNGNMA